MQIRHLLKIKPRKKITDPDMVMMNAKKTEDETSQPFDANKFEEKDLKLNF